MKKEYFKCRNDLHYTKYTKDEIINMININDFSTIKPFLKEMDYYCDKDTYLRCLNKTSKHVLERYIAIMRLPVYKKMGYEEEEKIMDAQEFQEKKKNLLLKAYKEKDYRIYPISYKEKNFLKELQSISDLVYRVEEDDFNDIFMIVLDAQKVEKELMKMGLIKLCPFRKRHVADEAYRESSDYSEDFLPCYQEKCMFYETTISEGFCKMINKI